MMLQLSLGHHINHLDSGVSLKPHEAAIDRNCGAGRQSIVDLIPAKLCDRIAAREIENNDFVHMNFVFMGNCGNSTSGEQTRKNNK